MDNNSFIGATTVIPKNSTIGMFSSVGENCQIGENVSIGSHVKISNHVVIGKNCIIADGVTICDNVEIGENSYIESQVVFVEKLYPRAKDELFAVPTRIGMNVVIHSKAVIESGANIGDGKIIDYGETVGRKKS